MTIEPETLRATALERLTTGPGPDTNLGVSPDGRRLTFTARTRHNRVWLFPFNATSGRVTGQGQAVTSPGMEAWNQNLSRDGTKLAFLVNRAGKNELWEKSLLSGREAPVASDAYIRQYPQWSPNGTRLAYIRHDPKSREGQYCVWSAKEPQRGTADNSHERSAASL